MSSWVQLLLALLAASLRCGAAEGDPLPAALVELVRNSPISSIEDLQLLLLSDSVDEEGGTSAANGGHRLPRSLDAQPAQQALCKVRTEVVEVTRAMLDRSNANFMLWPPCVEVQRCSGCCNTKSLQCVPVVTHTRYLQVMKIEYVNKRPTYAKAVVSVVDHVECRCQTAPRPPVFRKKSSRRQHHHHQHRNQTLSQAHGQIKEHSKDELHQWDDLKQNQRPHLDDLLEQHWSPRGDTFTQPGEGYSLAGEDTSHGGEAILLAPHWAHNSTRALGAKDQNEDLKGKNGGMSDSSKTVPTAENVGTEVKDQLVENKDGMLLNTTDRKLNERDGSRAEGTQTQSPFGQEDKSKFSKSHVSSFSHPVIQDHQASLSPTEAPSQRVGTRFRPTKEPNPEPRRRDNETPEEVRILQIAEEKLEQERKELLLLHKRLDQEKEILRQQQIRREEEERQKAKETDSHHHSHGKHHHLQTTTTQSPATTSTTTTTTSTITPRRASAPAHRPPARPRKRMRKNRKRISKAAMRAMLM